MRGLHFVDNSAKFFTAEIFELRHSLDFCSFEARMSAASKACQQLVQHESAAAILPGLGPLGDGISAIRDEGAAWLMRLSAKTASDCSAARSFRGVLRAS